MFGSEELGNPSSFFCQQVGVQVGCPNNCSESEDPASGNPASDFALSGFSKDDLNITVKENHLTIEGDYIRGEDLEYLHKGIAKRSFTRDFVLADTLNVEDVTFSEGILRVTLKQIVPEEQKPKKIKIN